MPACDALLPKPRAGIYSKHKQNWAKWNWERQIKASSGMTGSPGPCDRYMDVTSKCSTEAVASGYDFNRLYIKGLHKNDVTCSIIALVLSLNLQSFTLWSFAEIGTIPALDNGWFPSSPTASRLNDEEWGPGQGPPPANQPHLPHLECPLFPQLPARGLNCFFSPPPVPT